MQVLTNLPCVIWFAWRCANFGEKNISDNYTNVETTACCEPFFLSDYISYTSAVFISRKCKHFDISFSNSYWYEWMNKVQRKCSHYSIRKTFKYIKLGLLFSKLKKMELSLGLSWNVLLLFLLLNLVLFVWTVEVIIAFCFVLFFLSLQSSFVLKYKPSIASKQKKVWKWG